MSSWISTYVYHGRTGPDVDEIHRKYQQAGGTYVVFPGYKIPVDLDLIEYLAGDKTCH